MDEPVIAGRKPIVRELEVGTYYWCACGKSKDQPFCDGSHKGTNFSPMLVEVKEKKTFAFCVCKQSKTKPSCDGSHNKLKS